jgi:hypothetical protein
MRRFELTDARWERIAPLLPPQKPRTGRPAEDHRQVLNGMLQRGNQDETSASIKVRGTADLMMQGGRSPTGGIRSASA